MELLGKWVMYITGAAVLSSIVLSIVPKGRIKKAIKLICGLVTLLCMAYPVTNGMLSEIEGFELAENETEFIAQEAHQTERIVSRMVIEERFEAYILDKGKDYGIDIISADVTVRWSDDGYWYPVRADIHVTDIAVDKEPMTEDIFKELGVERNEIYWS